MEPTVLLKETRSYRPFKSSEEYLYAMREDLAEWINLMYPELMINVDNFMDRLDTGVALCKHANNVRNAAEEYVLRRQARQKSMTKSMTTGLAGPILSMGTVQCLMAAKSGTFFARDNVSNFISWCRKSLQIFECLLFETDDLIMRKNEKHVILCLLEVARRGAKFGMLAPMLVQMERQIDREIAAEMKASGVGKYTEDTGLTMITGTEMELFDSDTEDEDLEDESQLLIYGPQPQIVTNDLKSLDEMVRDLVEKCTCPSQFPMIRVSEGKYRIGETKVLIFVRILRSHVMVRVGGGWDTLSHYLDKHDPCRCKAQHRSSVAARLVTKPSLQTNGIELHKAQVFYERSPPATRKFQAPTTPVSNGNNLSTKNLTPTSIRARSRSRSPAVQRKPMLSNVVSPNQIPDKATLLASPRLSKRSVSPSPRHVSDIRKKQVSIELPIKSSENGSQISRKSINFINEEIIELPANEHANSTGENKYENISENGSEISDEGYRSLVQVNGMKVAKKTFNDQVTEEDSKVNGSLDQSWPKEESSTEVDCLTESKMEEQTCDKFFTEMEVGDISNSTGLRKTGFSEVLYDDSVPEGHRRSTSIINTKLPRTPLPTRRKSIDNSYVTSESLASSTAGVRKIPSFRASMRKSSSTSQQDISGAKENTWNGRSIGGTKKRPSLTTDTFQALQKNHRNASSGEIELLRSKGKRNKSISVNTSPIKTTNAIKDQKQSALAQQLLEAAGRAKNDAQILEKMKEILTTYSSKNDYEPEDFTSAWVNDYGQRDDLRCISKQNSLESENSSNSRLSQIMVSPRRNDKYDKGLLSKIPAPIRSNTHLY